MARESHRKQNLDNGCMQGAILGCASEKMEFRIFIFHFVHCTQLLSISELFSRMLRSVEITIVPAVVGDFDNDMVKYLS